MMSKINTAIREYKRGGVVPLMRVISDFILRRIPIFDVTLFPLFRELLIYHLKRRMEKEKNLDDILDTPFFHWRYGIYRSIRPEQVREEIKELAEIVKGIEPSTALEIGTGRGGTFYIWARYLPVSTLISIDLPLEKGVFSRVFTRAIPFFKSFASDKDLVFFREDSHDQETLERVKDKIKEAGKLDFLFIDGDHSYQGVKNDFKMYGQLVKNGGIIAFHDIYHLPDVGKFWKEIKDKYKTREIFFPSNKRPYSFGIGVIFK